MGSYAECWLGNFEIVSSKNDIDYSLISLFRDSDKYIQYYPANDLPEQLLHYQETQIERPEYAVVYYKAPAYLIKDRLNLMGYTKKTAEEAFISWIEGEKVRLKHYIANHKEGNSQIEEEDPDNEEEIIPQISMKDIYQSELDIISDLTPKKWREALNEIRQKRIYRESNAYYQGKFKNSLIGYMLSQNWYGFPGYDIYVPLRLILEDAQVDENLIYNVTDLIWAGYYGIEDNLVSFGLQVSAEEYSSKAKTIILTEGSTDTWVLKEALNVLYPHLAEYYSFLDFENAKIGGGVGNLANTVKAFAGAGIINNVIGLFDNDTAAESAIKSFEKIDLPVNIKILKLPELDLLSNYPTIGPSGNVMLNVNGIAASIELYFGEDILKLDGVNLTPIQWTGYDASLKKYQGEVLEKRLLQDKFKEKLKAVKYINKDDLDARWDPLKLIFKSIFNAFESRYRESICNLAIDHYSEYLDVK